MSIGDRKRRAWVSRERLIVAEADSLLREHGYLGLNLDHLAERIEYSKATIYNHFESKEDIVLAVANDHLATRAEFFSRALTFQGRTRERMFLLGIADGVIARRFPHSFPLIQLVRTQSLWEKASPASRDAWYVMTERCMKVGFEILKQARLEGDLAATSPSDAHILTGLVSLAKGAHLLADAPGPLFESSGVDPRETLKENYHVFLDGAEWRPFRREWDYAATEQRILAEAFAEETVQAE